MDLLALVDFDLGARHGGAARAAGRPKATKSALPMGTPTNWRPMSGREMGRSNRLGRSRCRVEACGNEVLG
jgi:hypothetical protein